jgi:hypothetical protein
MARKYEDRDHDIWTEGDDGLLRTCDYVGSYTVVNDAYGPLREITEPEPEAPPESGGTLDAERLLEGLRHLRETSSTSTEAYGIFDRLIGVVRDAAR